MNGIIERLRRHWSPEEAAKEMAIDFDPRNEMESQIRDFFHRIVAKGQGHPITLDLSEPNTGQIRWEITNHEGRPWATIWHEPQGE